MNQVAFHTWGSGVARGCVAVSKSKYDTPVLEGGQEVDMTPYPLTTVLETLILCLQRWPTRTHIPPPLPSTSSTIVSVMNLSMNSSSPPVFLLNYRFIPEKMGDTRNKFIMQPHRVSQEGFDACDTEHGQAIITAPTTEAFIVEDQYLQPGSNYFIGKLNYINFNAKFHAGVKCRKV